MTEYKTPEQIGREIAAQIRAEGFAAFLGRETWSPGDLWTHIASQAIEADRAQRQPEIYIVQNDAGDVLDVFRDADEATAAYPDDYYSIIVETVSEPGEYAADRIAELTTAWEESTGDTASDYALSEDDWKVGLSDDEAAEIARLTEWQEAQK